MTALLGILVFAILFMLVTTGITMNLKISESKRIMKRSTRYEKITTDFTKTLLILGDSTGAGVGADKPEESVPGRLAAYTGATYVENHAVSGAAVGDLPEQIAHVKRAEYDIILIHIGGNDLIPFRNAYETATELAIVLGTLPPAKNTYLMSCGNLGGATIFPIFIRPFHTWLNLEYHKAFSEVCKNRGIIYINLYHKSSEDPFIKDPKTYLAHDGLHPSSDGYELWFLDLKKALL